MQPFKTKQSRNPAQPGIVDARRKIAPSAVHRLQDEVLPPPPFAGNEQIAPILTGADLIREAHEMHHCVLGHFEGIPRGDVAIYRMLAPERATFSVVRENGTWRGGLIAGIRGATVSAAAFDAIVNWLKKALTYA